MFNGKIKDFSLLLINISQNQLGGKVCDSSCVNITQIFTGIPIQKS